MNRLYIISNVVSITDSQGRTIRDVAVYDEELLVDYLIGVTLKGHDVKKVAKIKKAIYHFLDHWENGEREITVSFSDFNITTHPTSYIEKEPGLIELGERPADPVREVYDALGKLQLSIECKSPNAAALYQELQDTIKKYPTLQIKEQA
jgi:hypothetical protein